MVEGKSAARLFLKSRNGSIAVSDASVLRIHYYLANRYWLRAITWVLLCWHVLFWIHLLAQKSTVSYIYIFWYKTTTLLIKIECLFICNTSGFIRFAENWLITFNMANRCGLCNVFAGKSDIWCRGACRRFFYVACVQQHTNSTSDLDPISFHCENSIRRSSSLV